MNENKDDDNKGAGKSDYWLAAALIVAGLVTSGLSLAEIKAHERQQLAQATQPLQGSPSNEKNAPAEAKPGGTRPTTPRAGAPRSAGAEGRRQARLAARTGRKGGPADQG